MKMKSEETTFGGQRESQCRMKKRLAHTLLLIVILNSATL